MNNSNQQKTLFINASQPQHTPAGMVLCKMYYGSFLESTLNRDQFSGFPHNGGEHTLRLRLSPPDLKAFLDLVLDHFKGSEGARNFVQSVQDKARMNYPRMQF